MIIHEEPEVSGREGGGECCHCSLSPGENIRGGPGLQAEQLGSLAQTVQPQPRPGRAEDVGGGQGGEGEVKLSLVRRGVQHQEAEEHHDGHQSEGLQEHVGQH